MRKVMKTAGVALMAASLLLAGSSCDQVKKQVSKKVAETVTKETTKKMATFETCDAALGTNLSDEQKAAFEKELDKIFSEAAQAQDKVAFVETKRADMRVLFQNSVKQAGANEKCTDLLTVKFMEDLKTKIQEAQ